VAALWINSIISERGEVLMVDVNCRPRGGLCGRGGRLYFYHLRDLFLKGTLFKLGWLIAFYPRRGAEI
jgi:hypothetical protein